MLMSTAKTNRLIVWSILEMQILGFETQNSASSTILGPRPLAFLRIHTPKCILQLARSRSKSANVSPRDKPNRQNRGS